MLNADDEWMDDSYRRGAIIREFEEKVGEKRRFLLCTRPVAVAAVLETLNRNVAKDPKKQPIKDIVETWLASSRCPKE